MPNSNIYSYEFQLNERINEQVKDLLTKLPAVCQDYIYRKNASEKFLPRTRLAYLQEHFLFFKYLCSAHEAFMDYEPSQIPNEIMKVITSDDVVAYLSYASSYENENGFYKNGAPGKARKLAAIRSLFKYMVSARIVPYNVAADVETPTIKHDDIIYMTSEQQTELLKNVYQGKHMKVYNKKESAVYDEKSITHLRDIAMIAMFLGTGIRVSELVGLDLTDVNFLDKSIYVRRKGDKSQKLFFGDDVEDALFSYLDYARSVWMKDNEYEDALFVSQRRKRVSVRTVQAVLEKYSKYTFGTSDKNKISVHKLRSTYATNLLEETGGDAYLVANVLGHSDMNTIQRYAKVTNQRLGAIELRKKDSE